MLSLPAKRASVQGDHASLSRVFLVLCIQLVSFGSYANRIAIKSSRSIESKYKEKCENVIPFVVDSCSRVAFCRDSRAASVVGGLGHCRWGRPAVGSHAAEAFLDACFADETGTVLEDVPEAE